MTRVLVWDLPTRAFHWLFATCFAGAFLTSDSEHWRDLHVVLGYTMLGLLAFRLAWGVIGTRYARFGSWRYGARSVLAYLRSLLTASPQHFVGHNPAGSWAIYGLLSLSLACGITGYAAFQDVGGEWLKDLHEFAANALLGLVFVHVAGVVISSFIHRENLVRAMMDGLKRAAPDAGIRHRHRMVAGALLVAVACAWIVLPRDLMSVDGNASLAASMSHRERIHAANSEHREHRRTERH